MTVIQIRGTSGSGKTTVMRKVIEAIQPLEKWEANFVTGRKKPLYYRTAVNKRGLYLLGHYDSACGGCDNIGSAAKVFELIQSVKKYSTTDGIVLCEGLLLSEDVKWSSQLKDLRVLFLTTPLETCLKQIEARRREAGNDKPLNPDNTSNRVKVVERARLRLIEASVYCRRASSSQAASIILGWIKSNG